MAKRRGPRYFFETNPGPKGSWVKDVMDAAEKDVRVFTGIDKASPEGDYEAVVRGHMRDGKLVVTHIEQARGVKLSNQFRALRRYFLSTAAEEI